MEFIEKANKVAFDGIGLSFIQSGKILKKIKDTFKNKILVSKIENLHGLNNVSNIAINSDLIMIDRGDLLAEVGIGNLYNAICEISKQAVFNKKPLIMATENLESMQKRLQPSKSEIIALEHSINLGTDFIMLSDETATSSNWRNTISWLNNYLNSRKKEKLKIIKPIEISEILQKLDSRVLVIFSKKGFFLEKFRGEKFSKLILFTEDKYLAKAANLKENINSFYAKFPKSNIDKFLYKTS